MSAASFLQAELISDDPRVDAQSAGIIAELRDFVRASREMRGLLTSGQAAKILGVNSSSINVWVRRGRLTSRDVLGVPMVSAAEVVALHRQRQQEAPSKGGRGHKAASLSDMVEAAWQDIDPLG